MQYFRRYQLATRYKVDPRTIDRMREDGRLPPPDLRNGKMPLWSDETIERNERQAAMRAAPSFKTDTARASQEEGASP
jgi:predicted site-specific integrase-resolvase